MISWKFISIIYNRIVVRNRGNTWLIFSGISLILNENCFSNQEINWNNVSLIYYASFAMLNLQQIQFFHASCIFEFHLPNKCHWPKFSIISFTCQRTVRNYLVPLDVMNYSSLNVPNFLHYSLFQMNIFLWIFTLVYITIIHT